MDASVVDEDLFEEGVMFDGSSIAGWKAINESDMVLMPDPNSAYIDPFFARSDPCHQLRHSRAAPPISRITATRAPSAKKAEALRQVFGIGDTVVFGPEPEFFIFDDVRYSPTPPTRSASRSTTRNCRPTTTPSTKAGNTGHHIGLKKGYFPVPPLDSAQDMRGEMLAAMASMGVTIEKHHHEVASAQHELGIKFKPR
jgi:glutamine synthetase